MTCSLCGAAASELIEAMDEGLVCRACATPEEVARYLESAERAFWRDMEERDG